MKELGDAALAGETKDDLKWRHDIIDAIEGENWKQAQELLIARKTLTAIASIRLIKERDSLLKIWRSQTHGLPERDRRRLTRDMERTTFFVISGSIYQTFLASLRKFLNAFNDILVKIATGLIIAAPAAIANHFVADQFDRIFNATLWRYFALVALFLVYRTVEIRLEEALNSRLVVIRKWGLRAEALDACMATLSERAWRAEIAKIRSTVLNEPSDKP